MNRVIINDSIVLVSRCDELCAQKRGLFPGPFIDRGLRTAVRPVMLDDADHGLA